MKSQKYLAVQDIDDVTVMEQIHEGDPEALSRLIRRYWQPVLGYTTRILDDRDSAADVAQQTFFRIWETRQKWRATGSVPSFIFRIARNLALNQRRATRLRGVWMARRAAEAQSLPLTPLQSLEEKELREDFERALRALTPRRREIFLLARVQNLSCGEIAEVTGLSAQTVANHMCGALSDLRRHLASYLVQ
jgi:RNA polymerase sigma-70 factor (ECF subfamily)